MAPEERAGFRLHRLEMLNWGTFDGRIWSLETAGETSLLTGDIGSGKSTVVDALTTLLIAPQKLTYNKAAGAEAKERNPRSYFLGYYKAEKSETGGARPVSLRGIHSHSVLLAQFYNEGIGQHVTLAQVLYMKEQEGQPSRICVVADQPLRIIDHFSDFEDLSALRRSLRGITREVHDTFPPYQAAFRKRFGIENDQALDLFHQTISMKSVGNLTDFVRQHMLQPFPIRERIDQLIRHFDDLSQAHEAVLRAKDQLARLEPLVADCDRFDEVTAKIAEETGCRNALVAWFGKRKVALLAAEIEEKDRQRVEEERKLDEAKRAVGGFETRRDELKVDIARNGGERLENLRREIKGREEERERRLERAAAYDREVEAARLPRVEDSQGFASNQRAAGERLRRSEEEAAKLLQVRVDAGIELKNLTENQRGLAAEVEALRRRKSNIPAEYQRIRADLCEALGVEEDELPFAGELMRVHPEEHLWEGAIERVLRSFGISLLVPDPHYERVVEWIDRKHLGLRFVYHRVRSDRRSVPASDPRAMVRKLQFQHSAPLASWVENEVARHFNLICCETLEEFRREKEALTRSGQQKGGLRHIKDDRKRIDDRLNYVLGWSNQEKLRVLEMELARIEKLAHKEADAITAAQRAEKELTNQSDALKAILRCERFEDLDWRHCALEIERLQKELRALRATSDVLKSLERGLEDLEKKLTRARKRKETSLGDLVRAEQALVGLRQQLARDEEVVASAPPEAVTRFPRLDELSDEAGNEEPLTLANATQRERTLREWLQRRIDADGARCTRLRDAIGNAMERFRGAYPLETREAGVTVDSAGEYRRMLGVLRDDDLPRFERHFKELLNEETIREIANFQGQLFREKSQIDERIETINRSLKGTEFNRGRYIKLLIESATDVEVRDFQRDLRACTENTLTGSLDDVYSEAKFVQVKQIIERFRGREGSTDADERWTRKVTDVRNWFSFSASERWLEDDREHEHYTDSGGKSGGQKEKLAYTVLAASLAYQFGLEWGERSSRSFRFVVIDEAFGRGSDESATYGLDLFRRLNLQLLVVTPLQKLHVIEPYVAHVGFVSNPSGERSQLRNFTIEEYQAEKARRTG